MLAKGREALATLVGGGSRGCKTKLVWTDWSHLMLNHQITPTPQGATGRIYLVQMGMKGPGTSPVTVDTRTSMCGRRPAGASSRARTCATRRGTTRCCRHPI